MRRASGPSKGSSAAWVAKAERSTDSPSSLSSALRASSSVGGSIGLPASTTDRHGASVPPAWVTDIATGPPSTPNTRWYAGSSQRSIALCGRRRSAQAVRSSRNGAPGPISSRERWGWAAMPTVIRQRGGRLDAPREQRLARDHEALDLRGALVELHDLRVAHQLLDRVLLDEAVAAVDLHGVRGDLHRGVRGEALGVRGLDGVAAALVEQDGRVPGRQAREVHLGGHVGDHELDRLVHGDRDAELDALLGVVRGELEGRAGDAGRHGRHAGARAVQGHHRELEAVVLLAEQVPHGDLGVVEGDGRGVRSALAHLVLVPVHRDAGVTRDHERGDAAVPGVGVGLGVDRVPVRVAAVGDERLRAVDDVCVAAA